MWSRNYKNCIRCKRISKKYKAKGLCVCCYGYITKPKNKDRSKIYRDKYLFGGNRAKRLEIDSKCGCCKAEKDLVVHHRNINKKNNVLENLQTLCRKCHSCLHKYLHYKYYFDSFGFSLE